jgi:hypothetical protein
MAQKTWVTGEAIVASDINLYLTGEGGAWTTWTPTITQGGGVACTVTRASYARYGRTIVAMAFLTVTGTGTAGNIVTLSLPVTAAHGSGVIGSAALSDLSAARTYPGIASLESTTTFSLLGTSTVSADIRLGIATSAFTVALANTDQISFTVTYEAAS